MAIPKSVDALNLMMPSAINRSGRMRHNRIFRAFENGRNQTLECPVLGCHIRSTFRR